MSILGYNNKLIYFFVGLSLVLSALVYAIELPDFDNYDDISEKKIGDEFLASIWSTGLVTENIENAYYIKRLGQKLVASSRAKNHFQFLLLNIDDINAFAGPYGYIGIYSGLITTSDTEAQLASVFAHEIAHITQNHLKRHKQGTKYDNYLLIASILASVAVGSGGASRAILSSTVAGVAQKGITYTREHEYEADRVGLKILASGGFDTKGMPEFFNKLLAVDNSNTLEFLRTHPLSINRVSESWQNADKYQGGIKSSFAYQALRARLLYQTNNPKLKTLPPILKLYVNTLSEFDKQNYKKAYNSAKILLKQNQENDVKILVARVFAKNGETKQAQQLLTSILQNDKNNEVAMYYLAEIMTQDNQLKPAIKKLRRYLKNNKDSSVYSYELLANLYLKDNNQAQYHMNLAESFINKKYFLDAKYQLQQALRNTFDEYLSARINAKLSQVESQIKD